MSKSVPSKGSGRSGSGSASMPGQPQAKGPASTPAAPQARTAEPKVQTSQVAQTGAAGAPAVTQEQIAVRAYEIWVGRGRPDGTDREDWFEAERQLTRS